MHRSRGSTTRSSIPASALLVAGLLLSAGCMEAPTPSPVAADQAPDVPGDTASPAPQVTRDLACVDLDTSFVDGRQLAAEATLGGPGGDDVFSARCVWSDAEGADPDEVRELPGSVSAYAVGSGQTVFAEVKAATVQEAEDDDATTVRDSPGALSLLESGDGWTRAEVLIATPWGYVDCTWTTAADRTDPGGTSQVVGSLCQDFRDLADRAREDAVAARSR